MLILICLLDSVRAYHMCSKHVCDRKKLNGGGGGGDHDDIRRSCTCESILVFLKSGMKIYRYIA